MTAPSSADDRLIVETGLEARIADIVEPLLEPLGFRLVRVRMTGANGLTLQIMAEREDGTMTVQDCETVSRAISPVLDVEDPIDRTYHLEVSSPGIDRPLVRRDDFRRWAGHVLKAETVVPIDGRKRYRGTIVEVQEDGFVLQTEEAGKEPPQLVRLAFSDLAEARLLLTDALIRDALAADKQARESARQAANENRPDHEN